MFAWNTKKSLAGMLVFNPDLLMVLMEAWAPELDTDPMLVGEKPPACASNSAVTL
jgi:hypothetical protein